MVLRIFSSETLTVGHDKLNSPVTRISRMDILKPTLMGA